MDTPLLSNRPGQMIGRFFAFEALLLVPIFVALGTGVFGIALFSAVGPAVYIFAIYLRFYKTKAASLEEIMRLKFLLGDLLQMGDPIPKPFFIGFESEVEVRVDDDILFAYLDSPEFDEFMEKLASGVLTQEDITSYETASVLAAQNPATQHYYLDLHLRTVDQIALYDALMKAYRGLHFQIKRDDGTTTPIAARDLIQAEVAVPKPAVAQNRILIQYAKKFPEIIEQYYSVYERSERDNLQTEDVIHASAEGDEEVDEEVARTGRLVRRFVYGLAGAAVVAAILSAAGVGWVGLFLSVPFLLLPRITKGLEAAVHKILGDRNNTIIKCSPHSEEAERRLARIQSYYGHNYVGKIHIYKITSAKHAFGPGQMSFYVVCPATFYEAFAFGIQSAYIGEFADVNGASLTMVEGQSFDGAPVFWVTSCAVEMNWMINILQIPQVLNNVKAHILLHIIGEFRGRLESESTARRLADAQNKELRAYLKQLRSQQEELARAADAGEIPDLIVNGPKLKMTMDENTRLRRVSYLSALAAVSMLIALVAVAAGGG